MAFDVEKFEREQNRTESLAALRNRMARPALASDINITLLRAPPRPAPKRGPTSAQITMVWVLALALGLALGVLSERAWTEANATQQAGDK